MIGRNDPCWCGSKEKWKKCHFPNPGSKTQYANLADEYLRKHRILLKTPEQIQGIRQACQMTSNILDEICRHAKEGVTTLELDDLANRLHKEAGAIPASLNYGDPPYPKSICTSLNEVICHGIPDQRTLKNGDIINIDVGTIYKGYYGDCSRMVAIGKISPERQLVCDVSYECLMRSIAILKPGIPISAIGDEITRYATSQSCSVVDVFVGHGVGLRYHENPQIPHSRNNISTLLVPGMTFTIEPMINAGVKEAVIDQKDGWTARTKDGKASAQWEHTLLITEEGHEILTTWVK